MGNMPKSNIIKAILSLIVIILCFLGLFNVLPYSICLPISLIILGVLNIWTGIEIKKSSPEKKSTANMSLFSGIFILFIVILTIISRLIQS